MMSETQGDASDAIMAIAPEDTSSISPNKEEEDVVMSGPPASTEDKEAARTEGESIVSMDSVATAVTPQTTTTSRVPEIWSSFFKRMEAIDRLELRVEEHVSRSRRRIMNLLEQTPSHRRTHLRMFVSHFFDRFKGIWTLSIEGKLLVGNIDHASASKVDSEGVMSVRDTNKKARPSDGDETSNQKVPSETGGPSTGSSNSAPADGMPTPDRFQQQYKIGEKEEDPVPPILFTHCFDKIEVTFRTIYQPRVAAAGNPAVPAASSFAKKSRSNKRKSGQQAQEEPLALNPKLLKASDPTKLVWRKTDSIDAHAFLVKYNNHFSERPPPPGMRFHSIVAKIELYPSRPGTRIGSSKYQFTHQQDVDAEPLYQIVHPVLAKRFFPRHALDAAKGAASGSQSTASPNPEPTGATTDPQNPESSQSRPVEDEPIPLENDIRIPSFLSYNEISMSLFRYIQDKSLHDPTDRSNILCDKLLKEIFEVESMSFGQLKQLLVQRKLIRRSGAPSSGTAASSLLSPQKGSGKPEEEPVMPITLTYIMNEQTTSPHVPTGYEEESEAAERSLEANDANASAIAKRRAAYAATEEDPDHNPTVLSFDTDVAIPSFFNYRARDLLRRVKKREFEYTTCRTKARYLLVASKGNEDTIKTRIEKSVSGQGYEKDNIPVLLALSKAAMPYSEARGAAQIDAKTCDIMERVEESNRSVGVAWKEVEAIREAMNGSAEEMEATT